MYMSNVVKTECKQCGKDFYPQRGSNCHKSKLCPGCIKKVQDKTGKFWQGK